VERRDAAPAVAPERLPWAEIDERPNPRAAERRAAGRAVLLNRDARWAAEVPPAQVWKEIAEQRLGAGELMAPQARHREWSLVWVAVELPAVEWRDCAGRAAVSESLEHGRLPANHRGTAALVPTDRDYASPAPAPYCRPIESTQLDLARDGSRARKGLVRVSARSAAASPEVRPDGQARVE
jgi:hypothetical protein